MKITDACVYPYPAGDSTINRLAFEAREYGYDSIVALDTPAAEIYGVTVLAGMYLAGSTLKEVHERARKASVSGVVVSVQAGDNGFNRTVAGTKSVSLLRGIHKADRHAFDHVTAKIAADNMTAIDLDLSVLVAGRGPLRQKAIRRYRDIVILQHRFEFPITISSSARSVLGLRPVREVAGLCSVIGMDLSDTELALAGISRIMRQADAAVKVIP
jgi:ribonuclease P/MRP protein subunit RPP1